MFPNQSKFTTDNKTKHPNPTQHTFARNSTTWPPAKHPRGFYPKKFPKNKNYPSLCLQKQHVIFCWYYSSHINLNCNHLPQLSSKQFPAKNPPFLLRKLRPRLAPHHLPSHGWFFQSEMTSLVEKRIQIYLQGILTWDWKRGNKYEMIQEFKNHKFVAKIIPSGKNYIYIYMI